MATQDRAGLGERGLKPCRAAENIGTSHTPSKWFSLLKRKKKKKLQKDKPFQRENVLFNPQANPAGKGGGGRHCSWAPELRQLQKVPEPLGPEPPGPGPTCRLRL